MLSRVIETRCRLFHSPVKFLRNKHDKMVTGKHLFFSCIGRTILVHTQHEQNYVGLVHFTNHAPKLFLDSLFSFIYSLLSILALIFISLFFLFISSCIFDLYSFIFFYVTATFHCIYFVFLYVLLRFFVFLFCFVYVFCFCFVLFWVFFLFCFCFLFCFLFLFLIWAIIPSSFKFSTSLLHIRPNYV